MHNGMYIPVISRANNRTVVLLLCWANKLKINNKRLRSEFELRRVALGETLLASSVSSCRHATSLCCNGVDAAKEASTC